MSTFNSITFLKDKKDLVICYSMVHKVIVMNKLAHKKAMFIWCHPTFAVIFPYHGISIIGVSALLVPALRFYLVHFGTMGSHSGRSHTKEERNKQTNKK